MAKGEGEGAVWVQNSCSFYYLGCSSTGVDQVYARSRRAYSGWRQRQGQYRHLSWARPFAVAATIGALYAALPASALVYREDIAQYNLNTNQQATAVTDFSTTRANKTYTPSPANWRKLPVYTILLDKFADGDPSNNDYFKTLFENDPNETQLRYGGDLRGLVNHLDYIQGMGIGLLFIAGTPFLNMPWQADSTFGANLA